MFRNMYFLKIIRKIRGLLKGKCRSYHLYKEKKCELRTAENSPSMVMVEFLSLVVGYSNASSFIFTLNIVLNMSNIQLIGAGKALTKIQ